MSITYNRGILVSCIGLVHHVAATSIPVVSDYSKLLKLCEDGGSSSYVGVRYEGDFYTTYSYGECYPYHLPDGRIAETAVFCKAGICVDNPNPDCTGGSALPAPLPIVPGLVLANAADFIRLIGQGATCNSI